MMLREVGNWLLVVPHVGVVHVHSDLCVSVEVVGE